MSNDESGSQEVDPCAICGDDEALGKNAMIFCDGPECDVPVHIKCYNVTEVPPGDSKWFCQRCEDNVPVKDTNVICCLSHTGAFKRTNHSHAYIHVPCAWWNNSVETVKDDESFLVEKWLVGNQECYICSQKVGLTLRCKAPGCKRWFHVSCAVENDIITLAKKKDIKYGVKCEQHKSAIHTEAPTSKTSQQSSSDLFMTDLNADIPRKRAASPLSITGRKRVMKSIDTEITSDFKDVLHRNLKVIKKAISDIEEGESIARVKKPKSANEEVQFTGRVSMQRENSAEQTNRIVKKEGTMALGSLLDDAFDKVDQEDEMKALKNQLLERPSKDAYQNLLEENRKLKIAASSSNHNSIDRKDRENIISIFSHLKLPNLPVPGEDNLSQYLSVLRAILDRSNTPADNGLSGSEV